MTDAPARPRVAYAKPERPNVYTVTYEGSRDLDSDVGYEYLRTLAARGYTVHVGGIAFTPAHTIRPTA